MLQLQVESLALIVSRKIRSVPIGRTKRKILACESCCECSAELFRILEAAMEKQQSRSQSCAIYFHVRYRWPKACGLLILQIGESELNEKAVAFSRFKQAFWSSAAKRMKIPRKIFAQFRGRKQKFCSKNLKFRGQKKNYFCSSYCFQVDFFIVQDSQG